ncbi:MAG: hypothetical protein DLM64_11090 [Solirubrobacterales bacterium]|nr:MAG: hypothetical protein DLM64_11090 [Solirubrobacterales bacterium]
MGRDILGAQQAGDWGDDIVGRIAEDLRTETGSARGFSRRNLFYMRRIAALWPDESVMAQISWTAHRTLLDRFARDPELYVWYASMAAEGRWSVRHLQGQISLKLHRRTGAAVMNFDAVLEPPDAERAFTSGSSSSACSTSRIDGTCRLGDRPRDVRGLAFLEHELAQLEGRGPGRRVACVDRGDAP